MNFSRLSYLVESFETGVADLVEERVNVARALAANDRRPTKFDLAVVFALTWTESPSHHLNCVNRLCATCAITRDVAPPAAAVCSFHESSILPPGRGLTTSPP